jgi:hypothetical protein
LSGRDTSVLFWWFLTTIDAKWQWLDQQLSLIPQGLSTQTICGFGHFNFIFFVFKASNHVQNKLTEDEECVTI